ncbi:hypothetical protein M1D97_15375 [Kushneria sp. AK178]
MPDRNSLHGEQAQNNHDVPSDETTLTRTPKDAPVEQGTPNGPTPG